MSRFQAPVFTALTAIFSLLSELPVMAEVQVVELKGDAGGKRFDGIGVVSGGGATAVLLKDYPEPQRSQILDSVFKPKFGASVSALLVEIPGDGNSTQGSMPSHMHTRNDLNYSRGYVWWILREAKKRNPDLTLDGTAWAAPGWLGNGKFWSLDTADYYVKWLEGLRNVYGLEFDAIGCRNEKGVSYEFVKMLRATLNANGFEKVKIHAFDNWPSNKLDFVKDMLTDDKLRDAIDIISAHTFTKIPVSVEVKEVAAKMGKPIWNTEEHVYLKGFDCAISIVQAFNDNFIRSGATKIVNWYDIAGVYPIEPYSEDPAAVLAHSPWSGYYRVREALWGYAHYGQFTQAGWRYINASELAGGGSFVALKSPDNDYSIIIETKGVKESQQIRFQISGGLSGKDLCVWRSNAKEQFIRQADLKPGETITLDPDSIYSLSTTTGQQKGSFDNIPPAKPFPFPYYETFEQYSDPKQYGYLPRYFADIADVFEIADRPDKKGKCLRQVVPVPPIFWAPEYMPYTIVGDDQWQDYEVSADVYLTPGDAAGVLGRVNNVGPGFRNVPKGYCFILSDDGHCRLVVIRGLKRDKKKLEGDAEQQALIKARRDDSEGGEKELGTIQLPNIAPNHWYNLKLHFEGTTITGFIDDKLVLTATNNLYTHGMAGLRAGSGIEKLSTPYFDNVLIKAVNTPLPQPSSAAPGQSPIYATNAGMVGDGTTLNTAAIQNAIDELAANGGGTISFPAGRYLTGTIQLKSNVTLRFEEGAALLGSTDVADYRNLDPFTDGSGNPMGHALIVAVDADNVGIEGTGTIDGQSPALKKKQNPYSMRPFLVRWVHCSNVRVKDVHLTNPGAWTLNFFQTKGAVIEGVTIRSRDLGMHNNDGINIDSSESIRIRNCDVISGDDALVIKSTSASKPSRDIVATNCRLSTRTNAIKLGTESIGGFSDITVSNCQVTNTKMAGIALYAVDGGDLRDVTISDITMAGVIVPISIRLGSRLKTFREGDQPKPTAGKLRDVTIKNVTAKNVEMIGMLINGVPGHPVEALTLENIQIEVPGGGTDARVQLPEKESAYPEFNMFGNTMPAYGVYARHVRGMKLQNVKTTSLKRDARPATVLIDVVD